MAAASTGTVSGVTAARPATARRAWYKPAIAAGVIAVVAGLSWMAFGGKGNAGPASGGLDRHRLAVLYFTDQSPDSSLGYLADGLTESLIDELSRVRGLDAISRNGVAPYRGGDVPRDSIARALAAGTLVDGSVDLAGSRLRVTVRLVDGASGAEIRRQAFELPANAHLAMRDSVAQQAAIFLREHLGEDIRLEEERAGTRNVDAWTLVQRAEKARKDAVRAFRGDDRGGAVPVAAHADSLLAAAQRADPRLVNPSRPR